MCNTMSIYVVLGTEARGFVYARQVLYLTEPRLQLGVCENEASERAQRVTLLATKPDHRNSIPWTLIPWTHIVGGS